MIYLQVERARRAIRVFLLVRGLCLKLSGEKETQLPLTNRNDCVQNDTVLDLSKFLSRSLTNSLEKILTLVNKVKFV